MLFCYELFEKLQWFIWMLFFISFSYFYGWLYIYFVFIFLFVFLTDMNNNDYSTQDDTSDKDYGEEENKNESENNVLILAAVAIEFVENYYMSYIAKEPYMTSSQTGYKWVMEILQGNPDMCKQNFRMKIHVFLYLCKKLKEICYLRSTRKLTKHKMSQRYNNHIYQMKILWTLSVIKLLIYL